MRSKTSEAFATRLSNEEATMVNDAVDETGGTKADFVRRAIRYYVAENPDRIVALCPEGSMDRFWWELTE